MLGEPNTKTRNEEVSKMFDYMFSQYSMHTLFKPGDTIGTVKVNKGNVKELTLTAGQNYSVLLKRTANAEGIRHELQVPKEVKAPVQAGQVLGKLVVYQGDKVLKEFELKSPEQVGKAGWWKLFKRTASKLFLVD